MDELVGQRADTAGIGDVVAEKAIGIAPGFLRSEDPTEQVHTHGDVIPGAAAAMRLGVGEIQNIARELVRFGRDKTGAETMSEIHSGMPGPGRFA